MCQYCSSILFTHGDRMRIILIWARLPLPDLLILNLDVIASYILFTIMSAARPLHWSELGVPHHMHLILHLNAIGLGFDNQHSLVRTNWRSQRNDMWKRHSHALVFPQKLNLCRESRTSVPWFPEQGRCNRFIDKKNIAEGIVCTVCGLASRVWSLTHFTATPNHQSR